MKSDCKNADAEDREFHPRELIIIGLDLAYALDALKLVRPAASAVVDGAGP